MGNSMTYSGQHEKKQKQLSREKRVESALKEARKRGLPRGWKMGIYPNTGRKKFVSPDGTRWTDSVPRAIAMANGRPVRKQKTISQKDTVKGAPKFSRKRSSSELSSGDQEDTDESSEDGDDNSANRSRSKNKRREKVSRKRSSSSKSLGLSEDDTDGSSEANDNSSRSSSTLSGEDSDSQRSTTGNLNIHSSSRSSLELSGDRDDSETSSDDDAGDHKSDSSKSSMSRAKSNQNSRKDAPKTTRNLSSKESSSETDDGNGNSQRKKGWRKRRRRGEQTNQHGQFESLGRMSQGSTGAKKSHPKSVVKQRKNERVLTVEEIAEALELGNKRGLPDGWTVRWHTRWDRKVWVSPDFGEGIGRRVVDTIPRALAISKRMGLLKAKDPLSSGRSTEGKMGLLESKRPISGPLSAEVIESSMAEAKSKGLPDGWQVIWNEKYRRKNWKSPEGKIYGNLSKAIKSLRHKKIKRELTSEELKSSLRYAKERGLPCGWTVKWSLKRRRKIWHSPDGMKQCDCLVKALAVASKEIKKRVSPISSSSVPVIEETSPGRVLTEEEIASTLEAAQSKGLPKDWRVYWNNKHKRKNWVSPDGKTYKSLSRALEVWRKQRSDPGLILNKQQQTELNPKSSESNATVPSTTRSGRAVKPSRPSRVNPSSIEKLKSPSRQKKSTHLISSENRNKKRSTISERERQLVDAMDDARKRGLPPGWIVKWDTRRKRKRWYYGDRSCETVPRALALSERLGLIGNSSHTEPSTSNENEGELQESGLPDGWKTTGNKESQKNKYISPNGTECHSLSQALAVTVQMFSSRYREMPKDEIYIALKEAKHLSDRWTLMWDIELKGHRWIAPDGRSFDRLETAVQANLELESKFEARKAWQRACGGGDESVDGFWV